MPTVQSGLISPNYSNFRCYSTTKVLFQEQGLKLKKKGPNYGITTKIN